MDRKRGCRNDALIPGGRSSEGRPKDEVEVAMEMRKLAMVSVLAAMLPLATAEARADAVLDWNAIAVTTAHTANPFAQGRFAAIVQLAVFEAVNSVTGEYQPYLGTMTRRPGASAEAAAVEAAYQTLSFYFGTGNATAQTALNNAWMSSMGAIPDGQAKTEGVAAGDEAALALITLRTGDGSASLPATTAPGPAGPGVWQLTTGCKAGIAYNWQFVKPFGISSAQDYLLGPPPALGSERYTRAYNEVMTLGASNSTQRPQDRANVVLFFQATSPTIAMNEAARQLAVEKGGTLTDHARALALMNMAINDALVASFYNKYHYNFWRPETAIHDGGTDSNPATMGDPAWAPFIATPCFPSYPSNHGSGVNAAAEVLRRLYGEAGHAITLTNPAVPTITLTYDRLREICDDVSDARVYGGIHFRTDQEAGADLGRGVGADVYKHNLRAVDE
ncbi:vanadium-dependent haloperoxidase [Acidobacteria bacterium AB60]|nr:vanadium-dependent haloperoxidase [Acidobacteria bacterium AB60]